MFRLALLALAVLQIVSVNAVDPCLSGRLVYSPRFQRCECQRHNGLMGTLRAECSATLEDGACVGTCESTQTPEQLALEEEVSKLCPVGTQACPVGPLEYECVSPAYDVDNCGGCASTGEGVACGDYPGVRGAACMLGVCQIYSCHHGFTLTNEDCIRSRARIKAMAAKS
uniref:Protein CPL1-like domain-containing protein n=1 Tax=Mycena chlorophos TaxID=658473 RepID=A0ABQ0LTF2_MYCCL|nr:predicted protein [Mycena chlorophos]